MGYESTSGLGVKNHYGQRGTQAGVASGGQLHGVGGAEFEHVIYITGDDFGSGTAFNTELTIPSGSSLVEAYAEITEAFALGGTAPTINVGTDTSESTNFAIELSQAQAQAVGHVYSTTSGGTFSSPLTADTAIGVALDGTSPTVTSAGKAKIVMKFLKI